MNLHRPYIPVAKASRQDKRAVVQYIWPTYRSRKTCILSPLYRSTVVVKDAIQLNPSNNNKNKNNGKVVEYRVGLIHL
jgi:hypothetical protein